MHISCLTWHFKCLTHTFSYPEHGRQFLGHFIFSNNARVILKLIISYFSLFSVSCFSAPLYFLLSSWSLYNFLWKFSSVFGKLWTFLLAFFSSHQSKLYFQICIYFLCSFLRLNEYLCRQTIALKTS